MAGQRCGVCAHPQLDEFEDALASATLPGEIARDMGVTRYAVMRHRKHHIAGAEQEHPADIEDAQDEPVRTPHVSDPQRAFLTAYAASCDIKQGLKAGGITRATFRKWQEHDPDFSLRFRQAETEAIESLEYEARLRAVAGSKLVRRVFRHGLLYEEIHEWRPSDAIMTRLLQAAKPEKYGDRLTVTQTTVVKAVDAEAWAAV